MRIFSMLAAAFGSAFVPLLTRGVSYPGHPGGPPHLPRGQAPARGILGGPAALVGSKSPSRRDSHRASVKLRAKNPIDGVQPHRAGPATYPDFKAQRAKEAKAARGRKARRRAAGN